MKIKPEQKMQHEVDLVNGRAVAGTLFPTDLGADLFRLLFDDETRSKSLFGEESTPEFARPVQNVEHLRPETFRRAFDEDILKF